VIWGTARSPESRDIAEIAEIGTAKTLPLINADHTDLKRSGGRVIARDLVIGREPNQRCLRSTTSESQRLRGTKAVYG
jgi:hypothetical protein